MKFDEGHTPAWVAASGDYAEVITALAEAKANLNTPNDDGVTPIDIAAAKGNINAIKALIKERIPFTIDQAEIAAANGQVTVIKIFCQAAGMDINALTTKKQSLAFTAASYGQTKVLAHLKEMGADLSAPRPIENATPAFIATENGHVEVIKFLIKCRADISTPLLNGVTPGYIAAHLDKAEIISLLATAKADLKWSTVEGETPVYAAAREGNLKSLKVLIKAKVDLNKPKNTGFSPIDVAAYQGHAKVVNMLFRAGVALEARLAHYAAYRGHTEIIDILESNGIEINKDVGNSTPLSLAITFGHLQFIKTLFNYRPDLIHGSLLEKAQPKDEETAAFLRVQLCKKFLDTYHWGENCPTIAVKQRRIIARAEKNIGTNTWISIYQEIIDLAKQEFRKPKTIAFFSDKQTLEEHHYLTLYKSSDSLEKAFVEHLQLSPLGSAIKVHPTSD